MQITSRAIKISFYITLFLTCNLKSVFANGLILHTNNGEDVVFSTKMKNIIATNKNRSVNYKVAKSISLYLHKAYETQLISEKIDSINMLFIILVREISRPSAMGQGYCGAGYEDHLLLVEILERKILLRDRLLLQSCLKSVSMFIDHGDDHPINGLTYEKDGSISYQLVADDDDVKRVLTIRDKLFYIKLKPLENKN
jgi:hypothetical protein